MSCAGCNWYKRGARIGRCALDNAMRSPHHGCDRFAPALDPYGSGAWWRAAGLGRVAWWRKHYKALDWLALRALSQASAHWHMENGADPATFSKLGA